MKWQNLNYAKRIIVHLKCGLLEKVWILKLNVPL